MKSVVTFALAVAGLALQTGAATIHVPTDQPTIQAGIDAASESDTVLVAPGTYTGDGNRDLDFGGKNIVVRSSGGPEETIIDCEGSYYEEHRGFHFHSGEDPTSVVEGFTITGGYKANSGAPFPDPDPGGGSAILCDDASPTISNCVLVGNAAARASGGGILCLSSDAVIENCLIIDNYGLDWGTGGGLAVAFSNVQVRSTLISGNTQELGGGVVCSNSQLVMENCTIAHNWAFGYPAGPFGDGGGILCSDTSDLEIINCIISGNHVSGELPGTGTNGSISCDETSAVLVTHSDFFDNTDGDWTSCVADQANVNGNFSADPVFCDADNGDYHLSVLSPCAAGNNSSGGLIGALDANCGYRTCGDADLDGELTADDIEALAAAYFGPPVPYYHTPNVDMDCDGTINLNDLIILAGYYYGYGPAPCCDPLPKRPDRPALNRNDGPNGD